MAICEFALTSINGKKPVCRTGEALQQIIAQNKLEKIYRPTTLKKEICDNLDPQAREQCPAFADLQQNGKKSSFCK
jgi:hypothetical protein